MADAEGENEAEIAGSAGHAELTSALRELMQAATAIDAPAATLNSFARSIRALAAQLTPWPKCDYGQTPLPKLASDFSPVGGVSSPILPHLELTPDPGDPARLLGRIHPPFHYAGPRGVLHGGLIAAIHDQMVASTARLHGHVAATAVLKVVYRSPTPIDRPLELSAWIERRDGRKLSLRSTCVQGGQLLSESEALLIRIDGDLLGASRRQG